MTRQEDTYRYEDRLRATEDAVSRLTVLMEQHEQEHDRDRRRSAWLVGLLVTVGVVLIPLAGGMAYRLMQQPVDEIKTDVKDISRKVSHIETTVNANTVIAAGASEAIKQQDDKFDRLIEALTREYNARSGK